MSSTPRTRVNDSPPANRPSLRLILLVGAALSVVALALVAATAVWAVANAERNLLRATQSYEQLALVTNLESDIGRLLIAEVRQIVGSAADEVPSAGAATTIDKDSLRARIDTLITRIEQEISGLDDERERAEERREFAAAYAIRALFNNMEHAIDRERRRVSRLDSGTMVREFVENVVRDDFESLNRIVRKVVSDERGEVEHAIAGMGGLRETLTRSVMVTMLVATAVLVWSAIFTHRLVTRPVQDLMAGSVALSRGETGTSVSVRGPREVAVLAHAFNDMAVEIERQRTELVASNEHLEAAVAERTQQLEQKAARLSEIDANRRLFFAKVGHELRTPLTALLGEADMAIRFPQSDREAALRQIVVSGAILNRRIADLLALARSDDGRLSLQRQPFDLAPTVESAVDAAQGYARSNDVALAVTLNVVGVQLIGDRDWFVQGLLAVIDNAIKFSPPNGRVAIDVSLQGEKVLIAVLDEGHGVEASDLERIFDPFVQADVSRHRSGTGLGLSVARWVAEHHRGRVTARNVEPAGLCIAFELPATP